MQHSVLAKRRADSAAVCAIIRRVENPGRHSRALAKAYEKIKLLVKEDNESEEGGRARDAVSRLTPAHQIELGWYVAWKHPAEFDDFLFELPQLPAAMLGLERILGCVN
ncbi:MAG: hypothetical protein ACAH17_03575 [Candidatus Paceibacterota bacterium]